MPVRNVFAGNVDRYEILAADGTLDESLAADTRDVLTDDKLKTLYEEMLVSRELDDAAFRLQRSGRMGTYPQSKGQEAASLGAAVALRKGHDHVVPAYRENAGLFHLGLPMHQVLLHWMGDERGNQIDPKLRISPTCVAIGAQCSHAAGIGWATRLENQKTGGDRVVMCFFGDGATSEGAFHDGLNFAAVTDAPVVFVCMNNGWAISVPARKQTKAQTFAQKALAYGMPAWQADGNDLFASYKASRDAVNHAKAGKGPAFVELTTYRLADHTTVDDARRYRTEEEHEAGIASDPLVRTRKWLESKQLWNDDAESAAKAKAKRIVKEIVSAAIEIEPSDSNVIFEHQFAEMLPELERQRDTRHTHGIGQEPKQDHLKETQLSDMVEAR